MRPCPARWVTSFLVTGTKPALAGRAGLPEWPVAGRLRCPGEAPADRTVADAVTPTPAHSCEAPGLTSMSSNPAPCSLRRPRRLSGRLRVPSADLQIRSGAVLGPG